MGISIGEIEERIQIIKDFAKHDNEAAHECEDRLHQDVLTAIAAGAPQADLLAEAALRTLQINFARWYS